MNIKEELIETLEGKKDLANFISSFRNPIKQQFLLEQSSEMDDWNVKLSNSQRLYHILHGFDRPICKCGNFKIYTKFSNGYTKTCGSNDCKNLEIKKGSAKRIENHKKKNFVTKLQQKKLDTLNNFDIYKEAKDANENGNLKGLMAQLQNPIKMCILLTETQELDNWKDIKKISNSLRIYHIINGFERPKCPVCNENRIFRDLGYGYNKTCMKRECMNVEIKTNGQATNLKKYGSTTPMVSKEVKDKIKKTNLEKYGVEHNWNNGTLREIGKDTLEEKTGFRHALQNKETLKKAQTTILEKFGTLDFLNSEKAKQTKIERYGSINHMKNPKVLEKLVKSVNKAKDEKLQKRINEGKFKIENIKILRTLNDCENGFRKIKTNEIEFTCSKCQSKYILNRNIFLFRSFGKSDNFNPCYKCNPPIRSKGQKQVQEFIEQNYNGMILPNHKKTFLNKAECDIYLPESNLGFEYNGVYWHSDKRDAKDFKNRHIEKSKLFQEHNINAIHIWEDDWILRTDIVKSHILHLLNKTPNKEYARNLNFKMVDSKIAKEFFEINHLRGHSVASLYFGLFKEDVLIMCLSLGKSRFNKNYDYEILRIATKLNTNVIGGFSKLISKLKTKLQIGSKIISYRDLDLSYIGGNGYLKSGFKSIGFSEPNYWYVKGIFRSHRMNFTKKKLVELGGDAEKSEFEIMKDNGYMRIYDSGTEKYSLIL